MPAGFAAYVRVFHPAYRVSESHRASVTWAELAQANGTRMHANAQLGSITGNERYEWRGQPGVFDQPPATGLIASELLAVLASVLAIDTQTPDECYFAIWEGFGRLPASVVSAPAFSVPERRYHLLTGALDGVHEIAALLDGQSPNLWWPQDRAWCVATEIDLKSTYIGADRRCAERLTSTPGAEAYRISSDSGIDWLSDPLNRRPADA